LVKRYKIYDYQANCVVFLIKKIVLNQRGVVHLLHKIFNVMI